MYTTTITVNGLGGSRFLAVLRASHTLPAVLAPLLAGTCDSVEVPRALADDIAEFVARACSAPEPPLLFSPAVGDTVAIVRDALCEVQTSRRANATPRVWRFVPRGTRGRVLAHEPEHDRVLLEPAREVAFIRPRTMTAARYWAG